MVHICGPKTHLDGRVAGDIFQQHPVHQVRFKGNGERESSFSLIVSGSHEDAPLTVQEIEGGVPDMGEAQQGLQEAQV